MNKFLMLFIIFSCLNTVLPAHAQKIIHGFVRDADTGNVLPVAHIRVVGTRNGTISNEQGEYAVELKTIPANVLVSYIGYKSRKLLITVDSPDEQNIELLPNPILLETIVVSGGDQAERIMREVIKRKQKWRKTLGTFRANAYTRINLINDVKIVSISESISEVFWDIDVGIREVIKSKRQTKNTMSDQNFASARLTSNLYDDDIDLFGFNVIGPTHPEALNYYDFKIVERQLLDANTVFVISVTPKSKLQPSFVGTIAVLDEDFAMIDVDLKPNEAIMFPPPLNRFDFAIEQKFSNFGQEYWLPVDVSLKGEIKIKLPGLEFPAIKYSQLTRFSDYEINVVLPDSLFPQKKTVQIAISNESISVGTVADGDNDKEISAKDSLDASIVNDDIESDQPAKDEIHDCTVGEKDISVDESYSDISVTDSTATTEHITDKEIISKDDTTAVKPVPVNTDSLFEHNSNMIPLTDEEKEAYSTIDSTMTMDKEFKPKGILTRLIKEDKDKKQKNKSGFSKTLSRAFTGFSPQLWHNRVDAYHLGVKYKRTIKERFTFVLSGAYLTGQERWTYGEEITYKWGKEKRGSIVLGAVTGTETRYHSDNYPLWLNSIQTLSGRRDYFDYYRNDKIHTAVGYRFKKQKTDVSARINLEHHESLSKSGNYILYGSDKDQRENPPIQKGQLRSVELSIAYGDSHSPLAVITKKGAEFRIEHSSPDLLSSDFLFTRYNVSLEWGLKTFLKRRLLSNTLDVRFIGGTSTGNLPIQRFGALDGSFMALTPFGAFRSLRNYPLEGEHYCALFMEHNFRTVPFELIGFRAIAKKGIGIIIHGASGRTWISEKRMKQLSYKPYYSDSFVSEIGLSLNGLFGFLRLDATKRLDTDDFTLGFCIARII